VARAVGEVTRSTQNIPGALGYFGTNFGEHGSALAPFQQLGSELFFQLADLHRKCWLAYGAILRRATEMPVSSERVEVAKLP
jgi:hypothetical protein